MAFVTATVPVSPPDDRRSKKRCYAVLHMFTRDGAHIGTEAFFAETTADGERAVIKRAGQVLERMLASLGPLMYRDVHVRLFKVQTDGEVFGLVVDVSDPGSGCEAIHLLPNDLGFFEPWDGTSDP